MDENQLNALYTLQLQGYEQLNGRPMPMEMRNELYAQLKETAAHVNDWSTQALLERVLLESAMVNTMLVAFIADKVIPVVGTSRQFEMACDSVNRLNLFGFMLQHRLKTSEMHAGLDALFEGVKHGFGEADSPSTGEGTDDTTGLDSPAPEPGSL